jgi:pimeloyl-ACP methyl ester carboxylesterase
MAAFVLVHGSGQNASCWSRVCRLLEARGHSVATPDLPKQAPAWGLADHAAEIAAAVADPRTVVVGHSFSGAFLPLVPEIRRCGLLVFLAAVVPDPGKSVREQFTEDPSMFSPAWIAAGPRWFDEAQKADLAREFLFHDCDEATLAWALDTIEFLDTKRLVTQPSPFTRWPGVPVASIVASEDRTLSPDWCRRISRRVLGREAIQIGAGHCPQVSQPEELASLLERLAARGAG